MKKYIQYIFIATLVSIIAINNVYSQTITTLAGNGTAGFSGDAGAATASELYSPISAAVDTSGNVYIADESNHRIRKINTSGIISTIAGNGTPGHSGDGGAATAAELNNPHDVAVDNNGNVYIADANNNRIRKINTSGIISTIAGNDTAGFSGDGDDATAAELYAPHGVAVDNSGNVYISDQGNNRIRKINASGIISTIAGNGTAGFSGDGGAATLAELYHPHGIAVDNIGNVFIADNDNHRIRKINIYEFISTIAGNGTLGFTGDGGAATASELNFPTDVAIDNSGNLYIADIGNNKIRKINYLGIISTFAGNGIGGFAGDGTAATSAELNAPVGVTVDNSGHVYISDEANYRIRLVSSLILLDSILGSSAICIGSTDSLTNSTPGGSWSSSDTAIATISPTGIVTPVTQGTDTIKYTLGSSFVYKIITINAAPSVSSITGTSSFCISTAYILSDTSTSGVWSATNINAFVDSTGIVTGLSIGIDTIQYTVTNSCGNATASKVITINPAPTVTGILGTNQVCTGSTDTLSNSTSGGIWSVLSPSIATISSTGVVSGLSNGVAFIRYTVSNSCGAISASVLVTVNSVPAVSSISGSSVVCQGSSLTLTDASTGGEWSVVTPSIATISATGVIFGLSAGTSQISYTLANICGTTAATKIITVNPLPDGGVLYGTDSLCVGAATTLIDTTSSGSGAGLWVGSSPSIALVTPIGTGISVVTGIASGLAIISYAVSNSCGTAIVTTNIIVRTIPNPAAIIGTDSLCAGSNITLSNTSTGGVWSVAAPTIATISPIGIVSGVSAGLAVISYTLTNSCGISAATASISVNTLPIVDTISGNSNICVGSTALLTNNSSGGTWSATNPTIATVSPTAINNGLINGITAGVTSISYTLTNSCGAFSSIKSITVHALPVISSISGDSIICIGTSTALTETVSAGVWSVSNTHASISSGIVSGISAGLDTIRYTVSNIFCTSMALFPITINAVPIAANITGSSDICIGLVSTFADTSTGGIWNLTNTNASNIGNIITGLSAGTDTIKYVITNTCGSDSAILPITIHYKPSIDTISGSSHICVGSLDTFTNSVSGGVWSTTNGNTTNSANFVTAITTGLDTVVYTVSNTYCSSIALKPITINSLPSAGIITCPSYLCLGTSGTATESVSGGVWRSSDTSKFTISNIGVITTLSEGWGSLLTESPTIYYTVLANGCISSANALIEIDNTATLSAITDTSFLCIGSSIALTDSIIDLGQYFVSAEYNQNWTSNNTSIVSIDSFGHAAGISAGTTTITYFNTNLCGTKTVTANITVHTIPTASSILGSTPFNLCVAATTTLADSTAGGVWYITNNNAICSSNVLLGVHAGIDTIWYVVSNLCGADTAKKTIVILPLPYAAPIVSTTPVNLCIGTIDTLIDSISGGVWSLKNTHATLDTNIITGLTAGIDTVQYKVTNTCGADSVSKMFTFYQMPNPSNIIGTENICPGSSYTYSDSLAGGTWSLSNINAGHIANIITGNNVGLDTLTYSVSNVCGTEFISKTLSINPLPNAGVIAGNGTVCVGATDTFADSVSGGIWSSLNINSTVIGHFATGAAAGTDSILYTVTNICGTTVASKGITVNPSAFPGILSGFTTICVGDTAIIASTVSGGIWSYYYGNVSISSSGSVVGLSPGIDLIQYLVTTVCGSAMGVKAITINPLPNASIILGTSTICSGNYVLFTDSIVAGTWSSSFPSIASVSTIGEVHAIAVGIDTIKYRVSNSCGNSTAISVISVNTLPDAGIILGLDTVCEGSTIISGVSVVGGSWSLSNTNAYQNAASITDTIQGVTSGLDTLYYTLGNSCGIDTVYKILHILGLPLAGTISGDTIVCVGNQDTLSETATGGLWLSSNSLVSIIPYTGHGIVVGLNKGLDTIIYKVLNACGVDSTVLQLTIDSIPQPHISGFTTVCLGIQDTLNCSLTGGLWNISNSLATISSGILTPVNSGLDTATYTVTNNCGTGIGQFPFIIFTTHQCDSFLNIKNIIPNQENINIYPNPTTGIFTIELLTLCNDINISITDMYGKIVLKKEHLNNIQKLTLQTTNLPSGTYLLNIQVDGKVFSEKLVIIGE